MVSRTLEVPNQYQTVPLIRALTPDDVEHLRLGPRDRDSESTVREVLREFPGRSVWAPEWNEFVLIAPWRHRQEIATVQSLSAVRFADHLLRTAVERCRAAGDSLLLSIEFDEVRHPAFHHRIGFELLEEIVALELSRPFPTTVASSRSYRRFDPYDREALDQVVALDHRAFPWLWHNSRAEFLSYTTTPGVEIYLRFDAGRLTSYVGFTWFAGWGHIDRIAVAPDSQHRGFGRETLAFAVDFLARRGARRIGLSTQYANGRSQRLYARFGFHRAIDHDYRIYGARLSHPATSIQPLGRLERQKKHRTIHRMEGSSPDG